LGAEDKFLIETPGAVFGLISNTVLDRDKGEMHYFRRQSISMIPEPAFPFNFQILGAS
jgi:hypothetical protein